MPVVRSPSWRARAKRGRSNPESGRATRYASRPSHAAPPAWIASAASRPRNDGGRGRAPATRPRLAARPPLRHCERERSEREAIQNRAGPHGTPPAHHLLRRPPGLLRPLRGLAMTADRAVPLPPRNDGGRGGAPAARARLAAWAPVMAGPPSVAASHAQGRNAGSTAGLLLTSSKQRHFLTLTEP